MKRYIALLLVLAVVLSLPACTEFDKQAQKSVSFLATILQITDDVIQVVPQKRSGESENTVKINVLTGGDTIYLDRTGRQIDRSQMQVGSRVCVSYLSGVTLTDNVQIQGREFVLQSAITTQTGAGIGSFDDCAEPPLLVIKTVDGTEQQLLSGNYEWTFPIHPDEMTTIVACGAHPLDDPESLYSFLYGDELYFDFTYPPNKVSVRCWPESCFGSAITAEAEVSTADYKSGVLHLQPGLHCYEVTASWQSESGTGGTAHYAFTANTLEKPVV